MTGRSSYRATRSAYSAGTGYKQPALGPPRLAQGRKTRLDEI